MESLIENEGFVGEHMVQTFMRNYEAKPWRGYGPGSPKIFSMMRTGEPGDKAPSKLYKGGSFGNGAAMRVAPIGLLYSTNLAKLRKITCKSSVITHTYELGREGAALQAYAVALAVNAQLDKEVDQEAFTAQLYIYAQHSLYRQKIASTKDLLSEQDRANVISVLGNDIEAFRPVPTAIYCFLKRSKSYTDAVLYAISLEGDTDTIASMARAISGAYLSVDAIPERWKERLENRPYIEALAEKLWQLRVKTDELN